MPYIDEQFIEDLKRRLGETEPPSCRADRSWKRADPATRAARPLETLGDEAFDAYKKIQRLVSVSERSTKGLRERLDRDGFSPESIEEALGRAVSYGIVDDRRYAEAYVRSKLRAGKGRRGIESELRDLGIDPDEIDEWTESESEDEVARALELLNRKPPTAKNKRDAAYRRLVSKGYSASAAQSAARIWSESL